MAEENQNEEPVFKVADRRKFNLDGSLRDGVTIEESKPKTEEPIAASQNAFTPESQTASPAAATDRTLNDLTQTSAAFSSDQQAATSDLPDDFADETALGGEDEIADGTEIPGADNPASFANFVLSLASQAASALGMAEEPTTGQVRVNLQSGKYLIDVLGMLADKTSGNLHPLEQKLFSQILGELRMQYVQIERMAAEQRRRQEDQLLKQAQQKFSGKDILGR